MTPFTLEDFIRESNRIEGIEGIEHADINAHRRLLAMSRLRVTDLELFVHSIQPGAGLRRRTGMNVRVGQHIAPPGGPAIVAALEPMLLTAHCTPESACATHHQYETLHPFTDGNGRSGRALWLWQMGGIERAPLGFLHTFYYQSLDAERQANEADS